MELMSKAFQQISFSLNAPHIAVHIGELFITHDTSLAFVYRIYRFARLDVPGSDLRSTNELVNSWMIFKASEIRESFNSFNVPPIGFSYVNTWTNSAALYLNE